MVDVLISGSFFGGGSHDIEASFNGGAYQTIATGAAGSFSGTLAGLSAGAGALVVRLKDDTSKSVTLSHFGIGDVYIIAGQSNAVGIGASNQSYAGTFAGVYRNSYVWQNLTDPVDSATNQIDTVSLDTDPAPAGSYWPLLATQIISGASVPVAFIPCAKGATKISEWQPGANHEDRSTLYGSMIYRARQMPNGIKAVLWHQGESDATINGFTGRAAYNAYLDTLANAIMDDLGVPLVAAKIHKWDGAPSTTQENVDEIHAAIDDAITDNPNVLAGPNFDSPTRVTSGLHFSTAGELTDAAGRWWTVLDGLFYT